MSENKCKACKRGASDVAYLFGLSKKVFICDGCVEFCRDIMGAKRCGAPDGSFNISSPDNTAGTK